MAKGGQGNKAMVEPSQAIGILPTPEAGSTLVSKPAGDGKIKQLWRELAANIRSDEERFSRMEEIYEAISQKLSLVGNSRPIDHRSVVSLQGEKSSLHNCIILNLNFML